MPKSPGLTATLTRLAAALLLLSTSGSWRPAHAASPRLGQALPADALAYVAVPRLATLLDLVRPALSDAQREFFTSIAGFDPMAPEALRAAGFAPDRSVEAALLDRATGAWAMVLSVEDAPAALATIRALAATAQLTPEPLDAPLVEVRGVDGLLFPQFNFPVVVFTHQDRLVLTSLDPAQPLPRGLDARAEVFRHATRLTSLSGRDRLGAKAVVRGLAREHGDAALVATLDGLLWQPLLGGAAPKKPGTNGLALSVRMSEERLQITAKVQQPSKARARLLGRRAPTLLRELPAELAGAAAFDLRPEGLAALLQLLPAPFDAPEVQERLRKSLDGGVALGLESLPNVAAGGSLRGVAVARTRHGSKLLALAHELWPAPGPAAVEAGTAAERVHPVVDSAGAPRGAWAVQGNLGWLSPDGEHLATVLAARESSAPAPPVSQALTATLPRGAGAVIVLDLARLAAQLPIALAPRDRGAARAQRAALTALGRAVATATAVPEGMALDLSVELAPGALSSFDGSPLLAWIDTGFGLWNFAVALRQPGCVALTRVLCDALSEERCRALQAEIAWSTPTADDHEACELVLSQPGRVERLIDELDSGNPLAPSPAAGPGSAPASDTP